MRKETELGNERSMRVRHVAERFRREGLASTLRLVSVRTVSWFRSRKEDRRRSVCTAREMTAADLGITDLCNHWYVATDYETFHRALRQVAIRPGEDVFADLGAGMGRIVLLAAEWPFRRVLGVEFSRELTDIARANLRTVRSSLKCQDVEIILADAAAWTIPPDVTVLFFFNPFDGVVLAEVCANIRKSLADAPRKLTIIYVRAEKFFEKEIAWQEWLTRTHELPCVEGKVAIYESKPAVPPERSGHGPAVATP